MIKTVLFMMLLYLITNFKDIIMEKVTRESGVELLRIIAAASVVFSHYCNDGGIFSGELGGVIILYSV